MQSRLLFVYLGVVQIKAEEFSPIVDRVDLSNKYIAFLDHSLLNKMDFRVVRLTKAFVT